MYLYCLFFHIFFVAIFSIYIFMDRLYVRTFFSKKSREFFYKKSKIPLIFISLIIVISGLILLIYSDYSNLLYLKLLTAISLLYGFFNCPFYMKKEGCEIRKFMYRFGVLILLIVTIILGLYI